MDKLLKLEEAAQFALAVWLFTQLPYAWWVFPACLLLPDISMLAYLFNPAVGARVYNLFHHKLTGVIIFFIGVWLEHPLLSLAGVILFAHAAMDRIFGYGLKYPDDFKHTHLGWIGKQNEQLR
jgi:hypothetical protein